MITREIVKVKETEYGLFVSAQTDKCYYGEAYTLTNINSPVYVESVDEAIGRFIRWYNQFEIGDNE